MCTELERRVSKSASQQVSGNPPPFDIERVNTALSGTVFHQKVQHFSTLDSTQTRALFDAQAGAEAGQVYIADEQTAGRGRGGHRWHSEPESGLYLSVLVKPRLSGSDVFQLSLAAGLALHGAVRATTAVQAEIRWPNDLVVARGDRARSRKAGGILTESVLAADGSVRYAVIGIGVNLNTEAFPVELAEIATSLRIESGMPVSRHALLIELLQHLDRELRQLDGEQNVLGDSRPLLDRFPGASSWVRGKRVHVAEDEGYTGVTDGLTATGLLRVRCEDGALRIVRHGGVREPGLDG